MVHYGAVAHNAPGGGCMMHAQVTNGSITAIRPLPADGIDLVALYTGNLVDGVVHALGAEYRPLY